MILKIHLTLLIALLYNLYIAKKSIYFIAYMFIIMHELSHMIVALLLNIDIKEIILLPFGATAKYSGNVNKCKELIIALSGPLASLLFAYLYDNDVYFKINLLIILLNMLPIFPLDGGRILKVILHFIFGEKIGNKLNNSLNIFFIIVSLFLILLFVNKTRNFSIIILWTYILKIFLEEKQKEKILSRINYLQINK